MDTPRNLERDEDLSGVRRGGRRDESGVSQNEPRGRERRGRAANQARERERTSQTPCNERNVNALLAEPGSVSSMLAIHMAERAHDWFRQAEADLRLARSARDAGHYEWSAFARQQAAEKAIKALFQHLHKEAWGHVLIALLGALPQENGPDAELMDRARVLDRHYIPTRYPNGFERGAPVDFYSQKDADEAIAHAETILGFCRNQIG